MWISWVGDFLLTGPKKKKKLAKKKMMIIFECEELGKMKDCVGCKIKRNWNEMWVKLTHPVMVQSFQDGLELDTHSKYSMTSSKPGKVLSKG